MVSTDGAQGGNTPPLKCIYSLPACPDCMVMYGHECLCSRVVLVIVGFNSTQAKQTHTENTFCSINVSADGVLMVWGLNWGSGNGSL